jgi:hypothetical protein
MRKTMLTLRTAAGLLLALTLAGCGGGGAGLPEGETGTVSGIVKLEGEPVEQGTSISFMRDSDGAIATGVCDAGGGYALQMKGGLSIVAGTYRIAVTAPSPTTGMTDEQAMELSMANKLPEEGDSKIPARYRNLTESTILFEVKPGANTFDLDMKNE